MTPRTDIKPDLTLGEALASVISLRASDLHLQAGSPPLIRSEGRLRPIRPDAPPLSAEDTRAALYDMLPSSRIAQFENQNEIDFAYSAPGIARFRVNAFVQRGTVTLILRVLPYEIPTIAELGLPDVVRRLAEEERGIVLVTGTTGSGKSTTLAAMVDHINGIAEKHIVTIEDPIEYVHVNRSCEVNQREVGSDTDSFAGALRRVLRQDPDVILIGEMRDEETVRTALSAAETGHLVLSTLHTMDTSESVNRILDFFPAHRQDQVRGMLAATLKGIVSQRLVPGRGRDGRVAICEVMTMTGRAHDVILDPTQGDQLQTVIAEGSFYGMQTFDQALYKALVDGRVTMDVALRYASRRHDFRLLVEAEGQMGTTMADVEAAANGTAAPVESDQMGK